MARNLNIIGFQKFSEPEDLSAYDGLEFRLKGDGRRYKVIIRTSPDWDALGYIAGFNTEKGKWQSIRLPFSSLRPIFRARTMPDAPPFNPNNVASLQLMFSKFEYDGKLNETFAESPFELLMSSIKTYINDPITPRFVHVGSAGVTRPERPGLDLSKKPPAVRLNKELDYILMFKLKGLESPADGRRSSESSYRIADNGSSRRTNGTLICFAMYFFSYLLMVDVLMNFFMYFLHYDAYYYNIRIL